jgi:tetratricopeptide (TPR) repeat protein
MIRLALEKGNFHKAERLLKKAIGLINSEKKYLQGVIFHNLGALYNRYSHYQKAVLNIQKAIDLFNYKNNPENGRNLKMIII